MRVFVKEYKHTQKLFAKTFSNPKINKDKLSIKQLQEDKEFYVIEQIFEVKPKVTKNYYPIL